MAVITICRGSHAGGSVVATQLSEQLGYPILSREDVLSEAARDYGISEKELGKTLSGAPPFWQQVPGKRLAYVKCVTAVILDHVRDGNLVYHGITGHLLLADLPQVLRVRVIADMQYRIVATMQEEGLSQNEAVAYIQRVDKERSRWARLLYGVEWEDPSLYDMILNLGKIGPENACATIAGMAAQKEFEATPESQKGLDDVTLSCRVWATLAKNPDARGAGIEVTADDGAVVIGGTVNSVKTLELVPEIAQRVAGVKSLRCEIGIGTDWYW
ncbi:MAG TPA: cytidylate kinase family protein [Candidatus Latescibacteria bacterium]|jgi:cytidylate kinase|nr:cytidylate kinase family protein [Candidatus Latescibacterota bacterium]HJP31918.1 cytidylate kinase family protein [Candidatus Latescibacterota bacterium]|tara:strand:- start:123 stop:938 length:816 start_codon:yes stop_codon:yes gene_type:complete